MGQGRRFYAISEVEMSGTHPSQELAQLSDAVLAPQAPYEIYGYTPHTVFMNTIMFYGLSSARRRPIPTRRPACRRDSLRYVADHTGAMIEACPVAVPNDVRTMPIPGGADRSGFQAGGGVGPVLDGGIGGYGH